MKKRYIPFVATLTFLAVAIIISPDKYAGRCLFGFTTWATCVLPSLFPFMIITLLFVKLGVADAIAHPFRRITNFFNLPKIATPCAILSLASGFPAGSKIVKEYYDGGAIDENGAQKLALICSTASPTFVMGSVGVKFFGDQAFGIKVYISHVLATLIIALIFSFKSKKPVKNQLILKTADQNLLFNVFYGAITSVAVAGGFISFFACITQFLQDFKLLYPLEALLSLFLEKDVATAFCTGLAEITGGCVALSKTSCPLSLPLCSFLITFSGASIILQQLSYLLPCKVNPLKFIAVKLSQASLSFFVALALSPL